MNEKEAKFLKVAKYYEELGDKMDEVRKELDSALDLLGLDHYFQDPETLAVYKIIKPKGKFISFKDVDYVRTALEGEARGTLSKKEAEEHNFYLKK